MTTERTAADGIPVFCAYDELVAPDSLKFHPLNPNQHPASQLAIYAQVIRANGWRESVTVSKRNGFVISGEGAVRAALRLGVTQVPVEYQGYESDEAEVADLLAQNRLGELSQIDNAVLKVALNGVGSFVHGYSEDFIAKLCKEVAAVPQYPIAARLNERHDFIVVYVDSETDWQFLKNIAGICTEQSFKNSNVGEGRVVPLSRFLVSLRENLHSIASARGVDDDTQAA